MASVVLENSTLKLCCSHAPSPGTAINQSAQWSQDLHIHTHSFTKMAIYTCMCIHSMYCTLVSVHEAVPAHTHTDKHCGPNHSCKMQFSESNININMLQTVLTVIYNAHYMFLHFYKTFYYVQKLQLSDAQCSTSVCKLKFICNWVNKLWEIINTL